MKTFITDMGKEYTNWKIENIISTAHHHQTVGTVERSHRMFNEFFRSYISLNKSDCDVWLQYFTYRFNTIPSMAHDYCPNELVIDRTANLPIQFNSVDNIDPLYNLDDYAK